MPLPRISVLLPVWNGEQYLAAAVDGILRQTFTDFELLVVDDGSTDGTAEILRACTDPRIRTLRLEHAGIVAALNAGIAAARAEWIARHDADDISHPYRFEKQWSMVSHSAATVLCHTGVELFGEGAVSVRPLRIARSRSLTALRLCFQCPIVHSTVMFKKSAVQSVGGYRQEERHAEDYGLWGRLIEVGEFSASTERLLSYRIHGGSVSHQQRETQLSLSYRTALRHARRFMGLSRAEAKRAVYALSRGREIADWTEWLWFISRCLPRLKYKSIETLCWVTMQSARMALKR